MRRYDAIEEILGVLGDELVVVNLGAPSREAYAIKDRDETFYMVASMGLASSIGLGVALSQDREVVVLDGDGAVLMNMGSLATIAYHKPSNLTLVVIDNGTYGSTGDQETISRTVGIEGIAAGCGLDTRTLDVKEDIGPKVRDAIEGPGPNVVVVKVDPGNAKVDNMPLSPIEIKERFMAEIAGRSG